MDVLVVAKAPVPGRVKTRLCPPCSPEEAAHVAEAALRDTLDGAVASGADRVVVALDGEPGPWLPPGVVVVPQGGGSFNDRLATTWAAARGPAVQIGMDTPQVDAEVLGKAFRALDDADAALGLAPDGGWWALAMRAPRTDVFAGIAMSAADTGARQLARLRSLGLDVALLDEQRDVDAWDDALAVAALRPASRFARAVGDVGAARR